MIDEHSTYVPVRLPRSNSARQFFLLLIEPHSLIIDLILFMLLGVSGGGGGTFSHNCISLSESSYKPQLCQ
jgi:hypothetical protein